MAPFFKGHATIAESRFGSTINRAGQRNGIRFVGTDGWILVNRDQIEASSHKTLSKPLPEDTEHLYQSNDPMGNFFDCMRTRKDPICPVEVGHHSSSNRHLTHEMRKPYDFSFFD